MQCSHTRESSAKLLKWMERKKQGHLENIAARSFTCSGFSEGLIFPAFWSLARAQKDESKMFCWLWQPWWKLQLLWKRRNKLCWKGDLQRSPWALLESRGMVFITNHVTLDLSVVIYTQLTKGKLQHKNDSVLNFHHIHFPCMYRWVLGSVILMRHYWTEFSICYSIVCKKCLFSFALIHKIQ